MLKAKYIIVIALLMLLSSCYMGKKQQALMNGWLKQSKHSLILSWGPPVKTADDGAGGEILIYAFPGTLGGQVYYDYRMFYVNESNRIYGWRAEKENVPPQQVNVNVFHR